MWFNRIVGVVAAVGILCATGAIGWYALHDAKKPKMTPNELQLIDHSDLEFDRNQYRPTGAVPQMPPITEMSIKGADDIQGEVDDDELVIGVELDGEARAYPINQLTGPIREILNDNLASTPIAATW